MENRDKARAEAIKGWIEERRKDNQTPTECIFYITVPRYTESLSKDDNIRAIQQIFDKYCIAYQEVDTYSGAYNLDRCWLEVEEIPCYIEYCGVYPVNWDIEDVVTLENMDREGKLIIQVMCKINGELVPNA